MESKIHSCNSQGTIDEIAHHALLDKNTLALAASLAPAIPTAVGTVATLAASAGRRPMF